MAGGGRFGICVGVDSVSTRRPPVFPAVFIRIRHQSISTLRYAYIFGSDRVEINLYPFLYLTQTESQGHLLGRAACVEFWDLGSEHVTTQAAVRLACVGRATGTCAQGSKQGARQAFIELGRSLAAPRVDPIPAEHVGQLSRSGPLGNR
jgi:hypothetical protein